MSSTGFELPYADLLRQLLASIFGALSELCAAERLSQELPEVSINRGFSWLEEKRSRRGIDEHLFSSPDPDRSLRTYSEGPVEHKTRISNLVRRAFEHSNDPSGNGKFLPSPLQIALDFLTVPGETASRAYAFTALRDFLFETLKLYPSGRDWSANAQSLRYNDIEEALFTIRSHIADRDNIPIGGSPAKQLLCHLFAMKGLMRLRFGALRNKAQVDPIKARLLYCEERRIAPPDGYEFRLASDVERLPDAAEIINQLWGVPLPIRGADTLFFGGLKSSSDGGLVMAVVGAPGTGKTSFALSLAAVLAPLGTRTFFLTGEEAVKDLHARLATLVPEFERQLSPYRKIADSKWFEAIRPPPGQRQARGNVLRSVVQELKSAIAGANPPSDGPRLPCPLIIVVDGVHAYLSTSDNSYPVDELITDLKDLGALVVVTVAAGRQLDGLDYLVDVVIELEYRNTEAPEEKPLRILMLKKTRHQISRPGAHVCHISEAQGFRIAPQLPSQLDLHSMNKVLLPNDKRSINVLNRPVRGDELDKIDHDRARVERFSIDTAAPHYLDLFPRAHILVHGIGSSGKAGFALKQLMAPIFDRTLNTIVTQSDEHRILIASFLYPELYYFNLRDRLAKLLRYEYPELSELGRVPIEVRHFFPGYFNPEDFFAEISQLLEKADLEGQPFDGILLDGLHNVFLQFPRLANNPMVWPMLYGMLRTRDITVVTTHTTFSVPNGTISGETDLMPAQVRPLLHALVQAADFFIDIEPSKDTDIEQTTFEISVRSALSQHMPTSDLYWQREKLVLHTWRPQPLIPGLLRQ